MENTSDELKIPVEDSKKFEPVVIPDDVYEDSEIVDIRRITLPDGKDIISIDFKITSDKYPEAKGKIISGLTSNLIRPKSKLYKWIKRITGVEPKIGEVYDLKSLIGKKAKILTQRKEKKRSTGEIYYHSNVVEVL